MDFYDIWYGSYALVDCPKFVLYNLLKLVITSQICEMGATKTAFVKVVCQHFYSNILKLHSQTLIYFFILFITYTKC
jgi:hypothetical protein